MSFYNDSTVAVQGTVNGKTLYLMIAEVMDTWVVDVVEKSSTGTWVQFGWRLEQPTVASIQAEGGVSKWLDGLCIRMTAFLQSVFVPGPVTSDPQTMAEVRAYVKAHAEFFDVGLRRK